MSLSTVALILVYVMLAAGFLYDLMMHGRVPAGWQRSRWVWAAAAGIAAITIPVWVVFGALAASAFLSLSTLSSYTFAVLRILILRQKSRHSPAN